MNATATAPCMSHSLSAATVTAAGAPAQGRAAGGGAMAAKKGTPGSAAPASAAVAGTVTGQVVTGQALTLVAAARQPMVLCVAAGRAWATLGEALHGPRGEVAGDVFLHAGQTLTVAAGQQVVLEPLDARALQYRWSPAPTVQ
jgi:hypothetical protein